MKSQELRIGNLILVNGVVQEVIELPFPDNCTSENTKPIPLTEEWCQQICIKHEINTIHLGEDYYITIEFNSCQGQDTGNIYEVWVYHNNALLKRCRYVHQLQNIYYELVESEEH